MLLIPEYWNAVARAIDAENQKASIFIKHAGSLGAAREAILRQLIVDQTPEPFAVQTGFICNLAQNYNTFKLTDFWLSKQCDVLVFDPRVDRPYYSIGNLAVVDPHSAKSVVEVKSALREDTFDEILGVWQDTHRFDVPTFGFAYDGVKFGTFIKHLSTRIESNKAGVPECVVVHKQNYIFCRTSYLLNPTDPERHRAAKYQFAVDFGNQDNASGSATAFFLEYYRHRVNGFLVPLDSYILSRFNNLELPNEAKMSIDDRGNVKCGAVQDT
jgi:hypothetical protein